MNEGHFYLMGDADTDANEAADAVKHRHPQAHLVARVSTPPAERKFELSKRWRWTILVGNGSHYVGINKLNLLGRTGPPAPTITAVDTLPVAPDKMRGGLRITWEAETSGAAADVASWRVLATTGGASAAAVWEEVGGGGCARTHVFQSLAAGVDYSFQVVGCTEGGGLGVPSTFSSKITCLPRAEVRRAATAAPGTRNRASQHMSVHLSCHGPRCDVPRWRS